jgi:hypothetical protein
MSEMEKDESGYGMADAGNGDEEQRSSFPESRMPNPESSVAGFPREMFLGLLRSGLWPATAIAYLRVSRAEWREARESDTKLAADTARAIASFEVIQLRNLHARIQQANDWRASAWWLAQRFPKRYGGARQGHEAERAVDDVLSLLDRALSAEFNSPAELGRIGDVFERVRAQRRD